MSSSVFESIEAIRRELGKDLTIVGHHYQSESVIRHADLRGDSLELARKTASADSPYIMFCGVFFMAESAALLAREGQEVHLPVPSSDCSMALMASASALEDTMCRLTRDGRKIIPLAYVNSTLAVKAVVGRYGGSVCTSANARIMLEWALGEGDAVLFLPDMNLGRNTANAMGISSLDCYTIPLEENGDLIAGPADNARLLLWPGYCSIHTHFTVDQITAMRAAYPGAKVVVHPECTPEVVAASDGAGSTSYLIRYAEEAPDGATVIIGTEANLVWRLAEQHKGRITVLPLTESLCSFMGQTTEERLATALKALVDNRSAMSESPYKVSVPLEEKAPAKAALERMLAACS